MGWQVLEHSQGGLDDIRYMALQPHNWQLLYHHRNCCDPTNALRPLVSVTAVDESRHELINNSWMAILCITETALNQESIDKA